MKKIMIILLTISFLITPMGFVTVGASEDLQLEFKFNNDFGNDTIKFEAEAQVLYDLGLFSGTSTTSFNPDLQAMTNREQAIKLIAVAMKWDINQNTTSAFKDVSAWAQPYVAKAVELGIANGVGNGQFGAKQAITVRQLNTMLLRVIGYGTDDAWNNTSDLFGKTFGIHLDQFEKVKLNRDKLVGSILVVLKNGEPLGKDYKLIENIVFGDEKKIEIAKQNMLISQNYEDIQLSLGASKTSVAIESMTAMVRGDIGVKSYVEALITKLASKPMDIGLGTFQDGWTNISETRYDYPTSMGDNNFIKYNCRFGSIALKKTESGYDLYNASFDENNYVSIYGKKIGEEVDEAYLGTLDVVESAFGFDTMYYTINCKELGRKLVLAAKHTYDEDMNLTRHLSAITVVIEK